MGKKPIKELKINDKVRIFDSELNGYKVYKIMDINKSNILGTKECTLKDYNNNIITKKISYNSSFQGFNALETALSINDLPININRIDNVDKLNKQNSISEGHITKGLDKYLGQEIKVLFCNASKYINTEIFVHILNEIVRGNIEVYEGATLRITINFTSQQTKIIKFIFINNYCDLTNKYVYEIMKIDEN